MPPPGASVTDVRLSPATDFTSDHVEPLAERWTFMPASVSAGFVKSTRTVVASTRDAASPVGVAGVLSVVLLPTALPAPAGFIGCTK